MLDVVNEIEKILKVEIAYGIMGFFKDYIPVVESSYLIEPQGSNISFDTFESLTEVPSIKAYIIESNVNTEFNDDRRDFFAKCGRVIKAMFANPTLSETVTQFSLECKYSSVKKDKPYKVCELNFKIEEML